MGNREKRQKRLERKLAKFAAAQSPALGPKSPAMCPAKAVLPRLSALGDAPWQAISGFLGPASRLTVAAVCRSAFVAVEAVRRRADAAPLALANAEVAAWRTARGFSADVCPDVAAFTDLYPDDVAAERGVSGALPEAQFRSYVFKLYLQRRSLLPKARKATPRPEVEQWVHGLLERGVVSVNAKQPRSGRSLAHIAARQHDTALLLQLINSDGFETFGVDDGRRTVLHVMAEENLFPQTHAFLKLCSVHELGTLANMKTAQGRTPVDAATALHHTRLATMLREAFTAIEEDEGSENDSWDE